MPDSTQPVTPEPAHSDRIATNLLRVARDPRSGRIKHRSSVDVALRAALFADLTMLGKIVDHAGAPAVVPMAEPTGDAKLDAVLAAVDGRPGIAWMRWFRHVSTDCVALRKELLTDGRWQQKRGWPASFTDADTDAVLALTHELERVAQYDRAPADTREAVLVTLAVAGGISGKRPRPTAVRQDLAPLVSSFGNETLQGVVTIAATAMRRTRRAGSPGWRRPPSPDGWRTRLGPSR